MRFIADHPIARVAKMAGGKILLARGIHRCPKFSFLLPYQRLYIVHNARARVYIYGSWGSVVVKALRY